MSVISLGLIRNIQVQVCNIANDTAFGDTQYICTRYPNFLFIQKKSQSTAVNFCEAANITNQTFSVVYYCMTLSW